MPGARRLLGCFWMAAIPTLALAQHCVDGRSEAQLLRRPYTSQVTGEQREYLLYLPKGYETERGRLWPVILFLHGNGERGDGRKDLDVLLRHGPLKEAWVNHRDLPFIMISPQMAPLDKTRLPDRPPRPRPAQPQGRPPLNRQVTGQAPPWEENGPPQGWWIYEKDVLWILDDVLGHFRADPDRVYLTGLSYGGFGTWYFAATYPDRWAAVAPICGAGNPKLIPAIAKARLPIWIFQGGRDPLVLAEWVLASARALEEAGHPDVRFTVHEDMGHNVWERVYEGWDLYEWFLRHRRQPASRPESLTSP